MLALMDEDGRKAYALRKQGEARLALREKAWLRAHPHIFISMPGESPFCIVCLQKEFDAWAREMNDKEAAWRSAYVDHLTDVILEEKRFVRQQIEDEYEGMEKARKHMLESAGRLVLSDAVNEYRRRKYDLETDYPPISLGFPWAITHMDGKKPTKELTFEEKPAHSIFLPPMSVENIDKLMWRFRQYLVKLGVIAITDDSEDVRRKTIMPDGYLYAGIGIYICVCCMNMFI